MINIKTDILIVGSGPAGSTAAKYASRSGASVTVIERRSEIGIPVRCGEFMPSNHEIKDMFPKVKDVDGTFSIPDRFKIVKTNAVKVIDPNGKETNLPLDGYTINRDVFDQYLASEARKAGAVLIKNCMFYNTENNVAITSHGKIEYKVIIGADGPGSRVARALGLPKNNHLYPAITAQAKGNFEKCVVMFFGGIAPGAYGWIIPKNGQANVGVGFSPKIASSTIKKYFNIFVERNNLKIISEPRGKYVPSEGPISQTVSGNGMVVGDSAGHVISVNGGGIPLAIIAGRICGEVASDNILNGRSLNDYENEWQRVMLKPLKIASFNKKLADTFAFSGGEWRTSLCMRLLGQRRMTNLIKCRHIFP
ncbi:MAG: NAD(P)/FAD-dependent oxidoreductase [archaeon]|nr:NAD(P)/FAD-dependent oxidoreductase [archaeon]